MEDELIRMAAFAWLSEQILIYGDELPRPLLEAGFEYKGHRITLIGPKGIWKPKYMELPISITTTPESPYDDSAIEDGNLLYKYRGTDPYHPDNSGLREVMRLKKPLIYFFGIIKGQYAPTWPVYIIFDNIKQLSFTLAIEEKANRNAVNEEEDPVAVYKRSYNTIQTITRLHQRSFRERVLRAYHNQCTLCRLRHKELLDAAHIIADSEDSGEPIIQNGLSLCKIHHAAYDKHILGITPDYIIKIRTDILRETDGPMLRYGIQSLENEKITLPASRKDWPGKDRLQQRFENFLKAV